MMGLRNVCTQCFGQMWHVLSTIFTCSVRVTEISHSMLGMHSLPLLTVCFHFIHMHTHTHIKHLCTHTHTHMHTHTCAHMHMSTNTHIHAQSHTHVQAPTHTHIHTHTHTHTAIVAKSVRQAKRDILLTKFWYVRRPSKDRSTGCAAAATAAT